MIMEIYADGSFLKEFTPDDDIEMIGNYVSAMEFTFGVENVDIIYRKKREEY